MSPNEPPASKENDMDALKSKLNEFIARSCVTQFEGDDLIQLLEEGESIDWIIEQLKGNSPAGPSSGSFIAPVNFDFTPSVASRTLLPAFKRSSNTPMTSHTRSSCRMPYPRAPILDSALTANNYRSIYLGQRLGW